MDAILNSLSGMLLYGAAAVTVLTVVVFVHELGHFLVARWCGVAVKAFSIGFGREIAGFDDRYGTRWKLSWIPLGGYVKFMDDENAASVPSRETIEQMSAEERAGSFHAKPLWQRAAVVAAGPIANFILAVFIFTLWFWSNGVYYAEPRASGVVADGPAARAGIKAGDLIKAIDGQPIRSFDGIPRIVGNSVGRPLEFEIERGGETLKLVVTPELTYRTDDKGDRLPTVMVGIEGKSLPENRKHVEFTLPEAFVRGSQETAHILNSTVIFFRDWFTGKRGGDELGGVIRITDMAGRVAEQGPHLLVILAASLSVGIGFLNLLPIPLLDGGHLLFYAIEAVRGKPLTERVQEIGFRIGLALVLTLMVFATFNDLHILKRWLVGAG
jgi:regulator of sigma E protease